MSADNPTYVRARELLEAELGDEIVALDAQDGLCFGFNEVATAIWRRLAEPVAVETLVDEFTTHYDVDRGECRTDVRETLTMLEKHRLIKAI